MKSMTEPYSYLNVSIRFLYKFFLRITTKITEIFIGLFISIDKGGLVWFIFLMAYQPLLVI